MNYVLNFNYIKIFKEHSDIFIDIKITFKPKYKYIQFKNIKLFLKYDLCYSHVEHLNYHYIVKSSNGLIRIISGCMFTAGLFASIQPCITVKFPALN